MLTFWLGQMRPLRQGPSSRLCVCSHFRPCLLRLKPATASFVTPRHCELQVLCIFYSASDAGATQPLLKQTRQAAALSKKAERAKGVLWRHAKELYCVHSCSCMLLARWAKMARAALWRIKLQEND